MFLLLLLLHRLMLIISQPPPPKKKKNWQNCRFVSLKTFVKTAQNQFLSFIAQKIFTKWAFFSYSGEICPKFFSKIPAKSAIFSVNLSLKLQRNLTFFQWPIRGPGLWIVYVIKVLDTVVFFSLSPSTFFPPLTSIMSSLDQSYFKKVKVWITLYIRSIKEQTKCPAI